ncbi:uncharacterized protein LOC119458680 [Dermacentor silvarum]|uniref:uncharacterized protein LOC119458680 n=1 Tax=Dermacentor silvarum TaxID=543639 RepID=UPI00189ADEC7|nr:uncharacterized protein LOC119458680 [Dermacentor silvarum]
MDDSTATTFSESTATLEASSTTSYQDTSVAEGSEGEEGNRCLGWLFPGVFYVFLAVLVIGLVLFEYKTAGVRQMIFAPAEITPEVIAPAVLRSGVSVNMAATATSAGSSPGAARPSKVEAGHTAAVTTASTNSSTAGTRGLMRRFLWPFGTATPVAKSTAPRWRPPASCSNVTVVTCDFESFRERAFYVAESSYGGFFCAEWLQHTHCPVNEDRFSVYSHCDSKCKAASGHKCDEPRFRLCTTADKVYQYYYSQGKCQPLDNDETGCLVGRNRFESEDACVQACGDLLTVVTLIEINAVSAEDEGLHALATGNTSGGSCHDAVWSSRRSR